MFKQVVFQGSSEQGIFCQALFGSSGCFEKVAGAPAFSDWETGDKLQDFIGTITKSDRQKYLYTLVNALGAGEYYGSNINADFFPWDALCHEGKEYGYQTFLDGHAFQHHKNKDATRAFGVPVLSLLNHSMKRVELVVRLDREKAKFEGAGGIITRIDDGDFPDVSMGCKVPFDVCSNCGHKSKTKADYCRCMAPLPELRHIWGPNKILPGGMRICVKNLYPRFFDLSFVFIGADKTAKVMAKLAQVGRAMCFGDICAVPRPSTEVYELSSGGVYVPETMAKTASACGCDCEDECSGDLVEDAFLKEAEKASQDDGRWSCGAFVASLPKGTKRPKKKTAEIVKEVPAGPFSLTRLPELEKTEPDLPDSLIEEASEHRLADVLGALGAMGIVAKPHEFMRLILRKMGEDDLEQELESAHSTLRPVNEFTDTPVDMDNGSDTIGKLLETLSRGVLQGRTAFGSPFAIRIQVRVQPKIPLPTRNPVEHPLLDKISSAYNGYRRELLKKLGQATELVQRDPRLREMVLGEGLTTMFAKTANAPTLSLDSASYMMGAYMADRSLLSTTAGAVCNEWPLFEEPSA